jgi:hypothetical protein
VFPGRSRLRRRTSRKAACPQHRTFFKLAWPHRTASAKPPGYRQIRLAERVGAHGPLHIISTRAARIGYGQNRYCDRRLCRDRMLQFARVMPDMPRHLGAKKSRDSSELLKTTTKQAHRWPHRITSRFQKLSAETAERGWRESHPLCHRPWPFMRSSPCRPQWTHPSRRSNPSR